MCNSRLCDHLFVGVDENGACPDAERMYGESEMVTHETEAGSMLTIDSVEAAV